MRQTAFVTAFVTRCCRMLLSIYLINSMIIIFFLSLFRLASTLLSRQQTRQSSDNQQSNNKVTDEPVVTPEIQSSIKEVTSAIVHFVNDQNNRAGTSNSQSRSMSPTSRYVYLKPCAIRNDITEMCSRIIFVFISFWWNNQTAISHECLT